MIDKKLKAVVQGGVDNYLGKQPQVQAPRKWQSSPDKPATELAYITEAEKDLILKANIHGGLEGGPNMGPSGIMSLDSFGDVGGAGASGGDTSAGGGANEGAGFSGKGGGESPADFSARVAKETAILQNAENIQARDLGYNARQDIVNRTYGPLQKYTGERGFLGNLFRGANKYGYTDTYTSGPNQGQVKPGYAGRFFGGLGSLLTGMPFVGGAIGSMYDYGKGIFGPKQKDMSQFNNLGLYTDRLTDPNYNYDGDFNDGVEDIFEDDVKPKNFFDNGDGDGYSQGDNTSSLYKPPTVTETGEVTSGGNILDFLQRFKVKEPYRMAKGNDYIAEDKAIAEQMKNFYT